MLARSRNIGLWDGPSCKAKDSRLEISRSLSQRNAQMCPTSDRTEDIVQNETGLTAQ
jgi:hypothetical protein